MPLEGSTNADFSLSSTQRWVTLSVTELETVGGTQKVSPHYCCSAGIECISVPGEGLSHWGKEGKEVIIEKEIVTSLSKTLSSATLQHVCVDCSAKQVFPCVAAPQKCCDQFESFRIAASVSAFHRKLRIQIG